MRKKRYIDIALCAILVFLYGCGQSLEDTYKDYAGDGEIRYLGQCTDLTVSTGWKHLIVKWTNNVDPIIEKIKLTCSKDDDVKEFLLDRGTSEFDITGLEEDGNYEISVCGVDKDGNTSTVNTVYGRPYTESHEEVMAFTRLISRHFFYKNHLILTFSGWDENVVSAELKYTKKNGEEASLPITQMEVLGYRQYLIEDEIDMTKPVELYRSGKIAGCDDVITFDPYVLLNERNFNSDMKQELKRQFGFDETIPDEWVDNLEELELDWNIGSLEDLLNFPKLKKLVLGKNRYLTDEAVSDSERGQSKLYDTEKAPWTWETLSDFVIRTMNELNGLTVERYNKHYTALSKQSYIAEMGQPTFPSLSFLDLTGKVFTALPEDQDGYDSHLEHLTDGNSETYWQPLQLSSFTTYEMILDLGETKTLHGLEFVQRKFANNDNQYIIAPSAVKIKVSTDQTNWENATYLEESTLGNSNGEISLIPFSEGGKNVRYVQLQINTATYYGYYNTSFAEIGLY